jgi:hypothetical protein
LPYASDLWIARRLEEAPRLADGKRPAAVPPCDAEHDGARRREYDDKPGTAAA